MDVAVLLTFATFFSLLVISTTTSHGLLRPSVRKPRLFRFALCCAAALTVPLDLYAVVHSTVGSGGAALAEVSDRLLLLNVAVSCGVAAIHEALRAPSVTTGRATALAEMPGFEPVLRMGVLGWVGPLIALVVLTAVVAVGMRENGPELGGLGPVWAWYSLLSCVISAYALLRRRARAAIDPQEG